MPEKKATGAEGPKRASAGRASTKHYCTGCGAEVIIGSEKYCPQCGTPVPKTSTAHASARPSAKTMPEKKTTGKGGPKRVSPGPAATKHYCVDCGAEVIVGATKFCPECGAPVQKASAVSSFAKSVAGAVKAAFGKLSSNGQSRRTYLLWGAGASVVVIAVVLGVVFGLRAAGPSFPAIVKAQGLAYKMTGGVPEGSVIDFSVEIARSPDEKVSVGVSEDEVAGTGDMWRAAAWTAPIAATTVLNLNLAEYDFDYDVSGRIDGPSAGALMTIATIAGLSGDELDSTVTITGTINPDLTIGPVGGIPQKLEGAAAAGKTTVLIPAGQRSMYDMATGYTVDLVQRGKELDLEVVEVADVFEAYVFFTGKQIATPKPPGGASPTLSPECYEVLEACTKTRLSETADNYDLYAQQPEDAQYIGEWDMMLAGEYADECLNSLAQGSIGEAYQQASMAMEYSTVGLLKAVAASIDPVDAAERLLTVSPESGISQLETVLVASLPTTIGEAGCIMDAWGMLALARSCTEEGNWAANEILSRSSMFSDDLLLAHAIEQYTSAVVSVSAAEDNLELLKVVKGPEIKAPDKINQLAEAYRRAAEANLAVLTSTVVPTVADQLGMTEEDTHYQLMAYDRCYSDAFVLSDQMASVISRLPEGPAQRYAVLGISFLAFSNSAAAIASQYDYGPQYDLFGNITGFTYDVPLRNALDLARSNAENTMLLADPSSESTVMPWLLLEAGHMLRDGDSYDKILALYCYWTATAQARTLMLIAG